MRVCVRVVPLQMNALGSCVFSCHIQTISEFLSLSLTLIMSLAPLSRCDKTGQSTKCDVSQRVQGVDFISLSKGMCVCVCVHVSIKSLCDLQRVFV